MFFNFKYHKNLFVFFIFFILLSCQLKEPYKNHGIIFLENRSKKLVVNTSNKNDVLKIIGQPHSKSISDENEWVYFERILTKGGYHKLGQNVLKSNNVLIINFDKYGILKNKKFLNKYDKKTVKFSKDNTENELSKKSFVEKFLNSVRSKMYSNRD
tara:strand:+ start:626 stop:1093 length:468 start_codon:yes stop_codon:yes gene_type:complete